MYRKGIATIILNNENQILLVNLITFKEGFFSIPGGGSEKDEDKRDTVKREIFEELGIGHQFIDIIKESDVPYIFNFKSPIIKENIEYIGQEKVCFLVKFKGENRDIKISKEEIRTYLWSEYKDLYKYLLFDEQLELIQTFIKELCPYIIKR